MSNEIQELSDKQQQWLEKQGIEESTWRALQHSLFPGANPASLQLYWSYCQARGLDPMKKPAHIVPMSVKDARSGSYVWQDVIMPGIAEARITANRTREYAGQDEPVFGPDVEHDIGGFLIEAPAYCTIRVHRKMGHRIATFAHTEYFDEAVSTTKDGKPNAMWKKRKRGMLAKVAESGALRKAFPEELGGEIMAEEAHTYAEMDVTPQQQTSGALDALRPATKPRDAAQQQNAPEEGPPNDMDPETGETPAPEAESPESGPVEPDSAPESASEPMPGYNDASVVDTEGEQPTSQAGQTEVVEPSQAKNTVELLGPDGGVKGEYQRAGSFLNALIKLLEHHSNDATQAEKVWHANRQVVDRIRSTGKHSDRLATIDDLCSDFQGNENWLDQYDTGQNEDAQLEEKAVQNLDDLVEQGDVEGVRERIKVAGKITNIDVQSRVLDTLDEALTEAGTGSGG